MNKNKIILLGGLVVLVASSLTMVANYPKLYSPYSFSVVIPGLFVSSFLPFKFAVYFVASFPTVMFYLVWSKVFINEPYKIGRPTIILSLILVTLSLVFNIGSYSYGLKYQGQLHTIAMNLYGLLFISALAFALKANLKKPTLTNCLGFNVLLFSWLGWVAFPWLGELI